MQKTIDVDIYRQGKCPYCGWWNCFLNEENPDIIAMPNLISLNKAKQLYKENKPFEPNLYEFNDEDFINNAKIDSKLLKDIWEETTERDWLQ